MKKKVFYYTSAYFLDVSVELIQALKHLVDLYVFIEVTDQSKKATILNIDTLPANTKMATPQELMNAATLENFEPYFAGTKSVQFVIHNYASANILKAYRTASPVREMIRQIRPDVLHLEGYTLRTIGLYPMFGSVQKCLLAVHDSQVHSGMKNIKVSIPRWLAFNWPIKKTLVFYSQYSKQDFVKNISHRPADYLLLKLYQFSFLGRLAGATQKGHDYILFFGRISAYKGLDILLDAMKAVWAEHPAEKLIVAGAGMDETIAAHPLLNGSDNRVVFRNEFIDSAELAILISKAKFVVCPYKDATQSGVLVSSFALNKPVLATNVGAFSEQLQDEVTGKIIPATDAKSVAETILYALQNERYRIWEQNLQEIGESNPWMLNAEILLKAYGQNKQ